MTIPLLFRDSRFWAGLLIRLVLIAAVAPAVQSTWFAPFLSSTSQHGLAPWDAFVAAGGDTAAFPYGWPYLIAFYPGAMIGDLLGGMPGARIGIGASILVWDFLLLAVLRGLARPPERRAVTAFYWLSPLTIYICYWHGQLDVFPTALIAACLLMILTYRWIAAGALFGLAIASKLSMVLPAPFIALYLLGGARLRRKAAPLILAATGVFTLFFAPFCLSPGFREMVLKTPESAKVFSFALPVGPNLSLYVLPIACLGVLYVAWRIRRLDFEMLWSFVGTVFLAFVLLTPASPGWAMWALPFITLHVIRSSFTGRLLYFAFAAAFVALHLVISSGALVLDRHDLAAPFGNLLPSEAAWTLSSTLFTVVLASGGALATQMFRRGVLENTFRAATKRPLAVGVSGDSGAGKDTLVESLSGLFEKGGVAHVSGDDYHIWDRHKPMWRALTHLNPKSNDLDAFAANVRNLAMGRAVRARHYDHGTGRMTKPVRIAPAEVVVASGLHALWSPALNALYDVRIYLDMDEDLRRRLKIRRDVEVRGATLSRVMEAFEKRAPDAERFIHPQRAAAGLVLRLEPRVPADLGPCSAQLRLRLVVRARRGEDFEPLARLLGSICGIQAVAYPLDDGDTEMVIEGEPSAEDVGVVGRRIAPELAKLFALDPEWKSGLSGVIQLVVIDHFERACRRRSTG